MQLAHVDKNSIRGTYNHALYLDGRREMMQWYADYIDSPPAGKVKSKILFLMFSSIKYFILWPTRLEDFCYYIIFASSNLLQNIIKSKLTFLNWQLQNTALQLFRYL